MANKAFGILYIDAGKAYFYGSNNSATLQIDIPADTMSYFDILNKEKFYQILQALVTTNKIEPVPVLILVSPNATYEKDVVGKTSEEISTETQQFLDSVPFEKVLNKTYKIQDITKIVATNKDLYEAVKHGFEKVHFSTVAIVSLAILQKMMPDIGTSLNLEILANKFDAIKQYSFITLEEINNPIKSSQEEVQSTKPNPMRLYGLIGVFAVLLGVLGFMVFVTLQPPKQVPVVKHIPRVVPVATPTPLPLAPVTKSGTSSGEVSGSAPRPTSSPTPIK